MDERALLDVVGDVPEMGARLWLPPSYYGVTIGVDNFDVTADKGDGAGLYPYVDLKNVVSDGGPGDGEEISGRVFIGPGQKGTGLGFMAHACKAITGQPPDLSTLAKFDIAPSQTEDPRAAREEIAERFLSLDAKARIDWGVAYARINQWNGKNAIVRLGYEVSDQVDSATGAATGRRFANTRLNGFHAVNDPQKGLAYVKRVCHPQQKEALAAGYDPREG